MHTQNKYIYSHNEKTTNKVHKQKSNCERWMRYVERDEKNLRIKKNHNHHIKSYGRTHASNMVTMYPNVNKIWLNWVITLSFAIIIVLFSICNYIGAINRIYKIRQIFIHNNSSLWIFESMQTMFNTAENLFIEMSSTNQCKMVVDCVWCVAAEIVMCGPFCSNNSQWNDLTMYICICVYRGRR